MAEVEQEQEKGNAITLRAEEDGTVTQAGLSTVLKAALSNAAKLASTGKSINEAESQDVLGTLAHLLGQKHERFCLSTEETMLRLCLLVARERQSPAPSKVRSLGQLLEEHLSATFHCNASAANIVSFVAYARILLSLHYFLEGMQPTDNELTLIDTSQDGREQDIIASWTGFKSGLTMSSKGAYRPESLLLRIPSMEACQEAERNEWHALLGTEAVRAKLREAYSRVAGDMAKSQDMWCLYHQFELSHLSSSPSASEIELVQALYQARIMAPHAQMDATLQSYSIFVSRYLPPKDYEGIMSSTYKLVATAKEIWSACEPYEVQLASSLSSHGATGSARWASWKDYITWSIHNSMRHLKRGTSRLPLDVESVCALFERAIASCGLPAPSVDELLASNDRLRAKEFSVTIQEQPNASREEKQMTRESGLQQLQDDEEASLDLWKRYLTYLNGAKASSAVASDVCNRAAQALPSSGSLHAQILRTFCRLRKSKSQIDEHFSQALTTVGAGRADSVVDLVLAYIDIGRELAGGNLLVRGAASDLSEAVGSLTQDTDSFMEVYSLLSFGLSLMEEKDLPPDQQLRLELLISEWCLRGGEETAALAESSWEKALHSQPSNSFAWLSASRYYRQRGISKKARSLLKRALDRRDMTSDKKVFIAEELVNFEHTFGGMVEIEWALERLDSERERSWSEYYAAYAATKEEQQSGPTQAGPEVDMADTSGVGGGKRKVGDESDRQPSISNSVTRTEKRGREGDARPARDRENSSVLVDLLPSDATEDDLIALFKDCGAIREITGPKVLSNDTTNHSAALVEFSSRDSIPAARSRQLRPIRSSQVNISMGWQCTLYVANFAPDFESDEEIRRLFGQFGTIFDVRWPSKKFLSSRRFCYVQYCNEMSARAALSLHEMEMQNGMTGEIIRMQVHLSDPNRKKVRSDAQSNERELFLTGLPRGVTEDEVGSLFNAGGAVENVRIPKHPDGRNKGIAFVDMKTALDAQVALGHSTEVEGGVRLKGKLITVTVADKKSSTNNGAGDSASRADKRDHRLRIRGLPHNAQEAIIQQIIEREAGLGTVRRVDWTPEEEAKGMAIVDFHDVAVAGRMALLSTLKYDAEHPLQLSSLESKAAAAQLSTSALSATASPASFAPRQTVRGGGRGRSRGGLGFARKAAATKPSSMLAQTNTDTEMYEDNPAPKKTQDAFREMLHKGT